MPYFDRLKKSLCKTIPLLETFRGSQRLRSVQGGHRPVELAYRGPDARGPDVRAGA
ncbi:hypothetical protein CBM2599_A10115 [Cupriavidus taiwanensis]|nr:hypothetical protein CBM2599_A10115 [Cupriavidus taiwanensis]